MNNQAEINRSQAYVGGPVCLLLRMRVTMKIAIIGAQYGRSRCPWFIKEANVDITGPIPVGVS